MKGAKRHPPTVVPAHAAIVPGQERWGLAVEADVALAAPQDHAATLRCRNYVGLLDDTLLSLFSKIGSSPGRRRKSAGKRRGP